MSSTRHLPQTLMAKALFFLTLMTTMTAAAQSNRGVQTLIFQVCQINKAGFSLMPSNGLNDGSQKDNAAGQVPLAMTSLKWVSTSDGKKISFQSTGSSKIVILGRASSEQSHDFAVENTTAAEVTLSTIGKSGSIDLEICRGPADKGASSEETISKIVYTFTSS